MDRIIGLEIGADDYVVKPFSPRELAARVKAILKRVNVSAVRAQPPLYNESISVNQSLHAEIASPAFTKEFTIDNDKKVIFYRHHPLPLTRLEFSLLQTLIAQPGRVFSREQLLNALGISADAGYDRNIDSHIKTLRAKLRAVDPASEPIKTQRGFGYAYQPAPLKQR